MIALSQKTQENSRWQTSSLLVFLSRVFIVERTLARTSVLTAFFAHTSDESHSCKQLLIHTDSTRNPFDGHVDLRLSDPAPKGKFSARYSLYNCLAMVGAILTPYVTRGLHDSTTETSPSPPLSRVLAGSLP